jgi:6-pyruvoyltetrahydropterin/6-carboxytetrahydropterin synthase
MNTTIYKTMTFDSAHQLEGHEKCGLLHGHTYKVELWLTGEPIGQWNFVYDFGAVKKYFNQYDHSNIINKDSVEIMVKKAVKFFFKEDNIKKVKVRIWETPTSYGEIEETK